MALALLFTACGGAVGSPGPSSSLPPGARSALEQIYVDGHAYMLQAELYRDLMPGPAPTPKRGVGGTVFLTPDLESDPPVGIRVDRTWLVNGSEVWEAVAHPLQTFAVDRQHHLAFAVFDGPTWDAGAKVDVVLQFSTSTGIYFIQHRAAQVVGAL
jgi:hypothetical protein